MVRFRESLRENLLGPNHREYADRGLHPDHAAARSALFPPGHGNVLVPAAGVGSSDCGRAQRLGTPVTFNTSEFLGNAMAVSISNTYSPNLRSWFDSTEKLGLMVGTDMLSNVVKEFGPDVKQHLPHRHHHGT